MAPTARQIESLRGAGIDMEVLDMQGIPKLKYVQAIPRMLARLGRVDLVHAHFGYCGWLARLQLSKPIVMSFMGDDLLGTPSGKGELTWFSRLMVKANRALAGRVAAVIVKSREMAEVLAPIKAHVIPNGVDLNVFRPQSPEEVRRRLGWPVEGRRVLFPGNPENPRKDYPLAQAAVASASRRVGERIELVSLWGVPPDEVADYMNACDAMLMTSRIEGSPNVVKEAMACDLPVASVPVGDAAELLANVPGYAVSPRDAEQLGESLTGLMESRQDIGGRQAILARRLDLKSVAQRVGEIYESVLAASQEKVHTTGALPRPLAKTSERA